jgi:nucleotide-binding universal stress UspA family protein
MRCVRGGVASQPTLYPQRDTQTRRDGNSLMHVRRILCATDFSVSADRALEHAVMLAESLHAEIQLLHVYQRSAGPAVMFSLRAPAQSEHKIAEHYHEQLNQIIDRYAENDVTIEGVLTEGPAWERIVSKAKELAVDMIVIGRNGRAGLSQSFVGSAAMRVVKHSPVPVLTVRA